MTYKEFVSLPEGTPVELAGVKGSKEYGNNVRWEGGHANGFYDGSPLLAAMKVVPKPKPELPYVYGFCRNFSNGYYPDTSLLLNISAKKLLVILRSGVSDLEKYFADGGE